MLIDIADHMIIYQLLVLLKSVWIPSFNAVFWQTLPCALLPAILYSEKNRSALP